ncbi:hypothetical protein DFH06DRAFT_1129968 [Mycena polygramma]|nr:hypothetical protein DFH06DRAFT_1129968 [Mycena polygramma]
MDSENTLEMLYGQQYTEPWTLIPVVILLYDHTLTFEAELNFVWRRPKKLSFYLFVLLRYVSLLSNIGMLVLRFSDIPLETCHALSIGKIGIIVLQCLLAFMVDYRGDMGCVDAGVGLRIPCPQAKASTALLLTIRRTQSYIHSALRGYTKENYLRLVVNGGFLLSGMAGAWEAQIPGSILSHIVRDGALYFALRYESNILMYYLGNVNLSPPDKTI